MEAKLSKQRLKEISKEVALTELNWKILKDARELPDSIQGTRLYDPRLEEFRDLTKSPIRTADY